MPIKYHRFAQIRGSLFLTLEGREKNAGLSIALHSSSGVIYSVRGADSFHFTPTNAAVRTEKSNTI